MYVQETSWARQGGGVSPTHTRPALGLPAMPEYSRPTPSTPCGASHPCPEKPSQPVNCVVTVGSSAVPAPSRQNAVPNTVNEPGGWIQTAASRSEDNEGCRSPRAPPMSSFCVSETVDRHADSDNDRSAAHASHLRRAREGIGGADADGGPRCTNADDPMAPGPCPIDGISSVQEKDVQQLKRAPQLTTYRDPRVAVADIVSSGPSPCDVKVKATAGAPCAVATVPSTSAVTTGAGLPPIPAEGAANGRGTNGDHHSKASIVKNGAGKTPLGPHASHRGAAPALELTKWTRPSVALSVGLRFLYRSLNARYCIQRRMEEEGPKYNNGYDTSEGHYIVLPGEEILGRYTVDGVLGKGSFGTVLRCYDSKRREMVALKVTRCGMHFRNQAKMELDILLKLNENANLNHLVVKLLKVFDWQRHLVLVFELLSYNLYQLIKYTRNTGVSLHLVRRFAYQLVQAMHQLEQQKPVPIVHCDIKPENILLQNENRSGIRLIDFGSSCYANRCTHKYIQSRYYRSPEVILNLPYGTAIDRWSLGCVLVELHTGWPLFDGSCEASQLARFEATLGPLPASMLTESPRASLFYSCDPTKGYALKKPAPTRRFLESVLGVATGGPRGCRRDTAGHDEESYREFHDFVSGLLRYVPSERMSCSDALTHPFLAPLLAAEQERQTKRQ